MADVANGLPQALSSLGHDVRLVMPAYREAKHKLTKNYSIAKISFLEGQVDLLESTLPGTNLVIWLIDCPELYDRPGGPYLDQTGHSWDDNAERFMLFARTVVAIATSKVGIKWQPDIVHCNDWQTGLVPVLLDYEPAKPGIIFTIHNLAYQGIFPHSTFLKLKLPEDLWSFERLEFYNHISFIKGGIIYSDYVNTVSPKFAEEIQTKDYGFGLDDCLKGISQKLSGITNGVNLDEWNPKKDSFIKYQYDISSLKNKTKNKLDFQHELGFEVNQDIPLVGVVSRMVEQKGTDLIIEVIKKFSKDKLQFVVLGTGDLKMQQELEKQACNNPSKVYVKVGYSEELAHKITASSDIFLMPSRFEPCGLNQMYSQIYGTIPIVRNTGGLSDTVVNITKNSIASNSATGFVFNEDSIEEFANSLKRAINLYKSKYYWELVQLNAMNQDFSWSNSAQQYLELYHRIASKKN